jgi:heme-degrading monooxygenase HmoA
MIVAIFRTRVRHEVADQYKVECARIREIAHKQPGFISSKSYYNDDGEKIGIQEWESPEHLRAWRDHPDHLVAQRRGKEEFYQDYTVYVCNEPRKYEFFRE